MAAQERVSGWLSGGELFWDYRGRMSNSTGRRPVRTLLLIAALIGAVLAVRAAVADKGGTYDPSATHR